MEFENGLLTGGIRAKFSLGSCTVCFLVPNPAFEARIVGKSKKKEIVYLKGRDVVEFSPFSDYLRLFFINIFLLHISGHSKICHFTRFFFSNQHVTGGEVSVNYLTNRKTNQLKMRITLTTTAQDLKEKTQNI